MQYRDVVCHQALKAITRPDLLFHGDYTVDPYQQCALGCGYCDSPNDVVDVKINIAEVLNRELPHVPSGRVILGSVHDPYQPIEETTKLSREVLMVLRDHGFSCHVLTKSPLIVRDLDVLTSFDCMVTVSLLSVDPMLAEVFEPCVASPQDRLTLVRTLRDAEVITGVALIPFLPILAEPNLEATVEAASDAAASFLIVKHLELKGEQRDKFFGMLQKYYPEVIGQYQLWYKDAISLSQTNQHRLERTVKDLCKKHRVQYGLSR